MSTRGAAFREDLDDVRHGSLNGYTNLHCRCKRCAEAQRQYMAAARKRLRSQAIPAHVHGTTNGYLNYSCRCDPCTNSHTDYRREWAREKRAKA